MNNTLATIIPDIFKAVFIDKEDDQHQLSSTFSYKGKSFMYVREHVSEFSNKDLMCVLILYDLNMNYKDHGNDYKNNFMHQKRIRKAYRYIAQVVKSEQADAYGYLDYTPPTTTKKSEFDVKNLIKSDGFFAKQPPYVGSGGTKKRRGSKNSNSKKKIVSDTYSCCSCDDSSSDYEYAAVNKKTSTETTLKDLLKDKKYKCSEKVVDDGLDKIDGLEKEEEKVDGDNSNINLVNSIAKMIKDTSAVGKDKSLTKNEQFDKYGQLFGQYFKNLMNDGIAGKDIEINEKKEIPIEEEDCCYYEDKAVVI